MFDYNKYKRMKSIENEAEWALRDMFALMYCERVRGYVILRDKIINNMSNNLLHLNRLMVAYTKYGEKAEIDYIFKHLDLKDSWSNCHESHKNTEWFRKSKKAIRLFYNYIRYSLYRDVGIDLSNNQEENNKLNNELREEYRSVIYQTLDMVD